MNLQTMISLGLALGLAPLSEASATATARDSLPTPTAALPDLAPQLTPPALAVLKMVTSGVPDEVVKAYIQNSSSAFNLMPEHIAQLKDNGVSENVTAAMLSHDEELVNKTAVTPPSSAAPTAEAPTTLPVVPATVADTDQEVSAETIYNNLARYGDWNHVAGFGWCWQPYSWLGDGYYPRSWLSYGSWCSFRTRGWCWVPSSHFHMSSYCRRVDAFGGNRVSFVNNRSASSGLGGGQFHARTATQPASFGRPMVINHGAGGVRLANRGIVRSSLSGSFHAGVSSSFHGSVSSFHGGASCGFRGGTGCGVHAGGGGGFHGGGRGHR